MTDRPELHSLRGILQVSGTMYRVEDVGASFSVEMVEASINIPIIDDRQDSPDRPVSP